MQCLSPSYIGECPESCILMYETIMTKLEEYNIITPSSADVSKLLYHKFLSTVVKENKEEFMKFDKAMQRLDVFLRKFNGGPLSNAKIGCFLEKFSGGSSRFSKLCDTFKILLILSHGQSPFRKRF